MPFDKFEIHESKSHLNITSIRNYRTILNKLALAGYDTIEKVKKNHKPIIKWVDDTYGKTEESKQKRRFAMSAVFLALAATPESEKKAYHKYFQKLYPAKRIDGTAWTSKEEWANEKKNRDDSSSDSE